jgi:hypothetical protein
MEKSLLCETVLISLNMYRILVCDENEWNVINRLDLGS